MVKLNTPVVYARPLQDLAGIYPQWLHPETRRTLEIPVASLQPPDSPGLTSGKVVHGNDLGAVLTQPVASYENVEYHTISIHWSNWSYQIITFSKDIRSWTMISDVDIFWDNWKIYSALGTLLFNLGSGKSFTFDYPMRRFSIKRNMDNYSIRFDFYGIY